MRVRGRKPSPLRPQARSRPGRSNYDALGDDRVRREYVVGLEEASERIAAELNATRLALAVMLHRQGGEVMIGESDLQIVQGRKIVSDKVDFPAGAWVFKLVEGRPDA